MVLPWWKTITKYFILIDKEEHTMNREGSLQLAVYS